MGAYEKLRPARDQEYFYEVAQRDFQFSLSVYRLVLNSRRPLKEKEIRKTLSLLFNHVCILRLCMRKEEEGFWMCNMKEEKIDLEILKNPEFDDAFHKTIHTSFDSSAGPMWRVKLLLENRTVTDIDERIITAGFMYENQIMFCFHHAITDGFTSFTVCNVFLKMLNDVVAGRNTTYTESFGVFGSGEETKRLVTERMKYLEQNPELFKKVQEEIASYNNLKVLLQEAYPSDPKEKNCTRNIARTLGVEETSKLIKIFKNHKVTVHGGFCAVANWALVELLQEKGVLKDTYNIGVYHAMNLRRYWPAEAVPTLGCHIGSIRIVASVDANVGHHIWDHARTYTKTLQSHLCNKRPMDELIAIKLTSDSGDTDLHKIFTNPSPPQLCYSTTNMGDLSHLLPGTGDQVEITWLNRSTSHYRMHIVMVHVLQTFRGRLLYSLDYTLKYASTEFAQKYVERIHRKLMQITESGELLINK